MNPKDVRILRLLEAVESNGGASQRTLAESLRISLGLVNTNFRKLTAAGLFKASSNQKGHVKYELTGKGLNEKARLTYEYVLSSYRSYKDAIARLAGFFADLETMNVYRLVFLGANDFAEMAYLGMKESSLEMVAVVDEKKKGQRFFENRVESISVLGALSFDRLLVTDPDAGRDDLPRNMLSQIEYDKVIFAPFQAVAQEGYGSEAEND
jgi:DNA-binding Lrp family transcriptional regulator